MLRKYKNMTDEELDQLFKTAAEEQGLKDTPNGAWQHFLEKNEQQFLATEEPGVAMPKKGKLAMFPGWYWRAAGILIAVAGGALIWWLMGQQKTSGDLASQPAKVSKPSSVEKLLKEDGQDEPVKPDASEVAANNSQKVLDKNVMMMPVLNPAKKTTDGIPEIVNNGSIQPVKEAGAQDRSLQRPPSPAVNNKKQEEGAAPVNEHKSGGKMQQNEWAYYNLKKVIDNKEAHSRGKWQVGVLGGGNVSMVKGTASGTPGVNAGIVVQRRLGNSRFSLESGVVYENMNYGVKNEDFNPNGKPVSARVSNITGSCTMLNVPVNVRYDVTSSKKHKAFVSTGVSPTVMVQQTYVYDYTDASGTRNITRDVSGQGKEFYAVANVSVGYEQKWSRTSVQIAPYLKIPVGEIGYGDLSLGGIGTQISIKRDL